MILMSLFETDAYKEFENACIRFAISMKVYLLLHPVLLYDLLEAPKYDEV